MPRKFSDEPETSRLSRSAKLRKYGSVYKSYIRKSEQSKISKSPRRPRNNPSKNHKIHNTYIQHKSRKERVKNKIVEDTASITPERRSKRKPLNEYQKFVKRESKKEKYEKMPGKERFSAIANEWKRINRK